VIHYRSEIRASGVDARALKRTLRKLLAEVGEPNSAISLTLVDDETIRGINREHRNKDKPTDVLSFPLYHPSSALAPVPVIPSSSREAPQALGEPERLLGDIVISVDTARRQAADYDAPLQSELYRLMIHGLLHVLGHDHEEPGERARMESEERRLASAIGMPWPY
jgi:probable rRNA maturation factor